MEPNTVDSTDSADRARCCAALRELAAFLQAHPALPLPTFVSISPLIACGDDESDRAEVDRIAGILGVEPVVTAGGGQYRAERRFGAGSGCGIAYSAVAITAEHMAQWRALTSYDGLVTP